jgi:hypothetical protein
MLKVIRLSNASKGLEMDFCMTPAALYAFEIPIEASGLLQSVNENAQFFTPRQIPMAEKATNLYERIGRPS